MVKEEYDRQIDIPKPILIKIICLLELKEISSALLSCKQFYFLSKMDSFWLNLVDQKTEIKKEELKELSKENSFKQIFLDSLMGWDLESSNHEFLNYKGNVVKHEKQYNLATAFTKKRFITGEKNMLFTFELTITQSSNYATGINKPTTGNTNWLHGSGWGEYNFTNPGNTAFVIKVLITKEPRYYIYNSTIKDYLHQRDVEANNLVCFHVIISFGGDEVKFISVKEIDQVPSLIDKSFLDSL
eukprot:TRINITY_DN1084_c0_g1_i1.p1 TRINITY_DN1084_c0_g1~~TRINITY_DN1084_c0_g1_i1.p1  ORF type:complete len:243 (-),score=61.97 TRINITY_DN1084_c0_g1_i1:76-804(-)